MKLLKLEESKSISDYEKEWEEMKGHKTCDECGTRLNDKGTCPKCDDGEEESLRESNDIKNRVDADTANEIALLAMRALNLKEHEADTLEKDLIEGNVDKWIKDFESLPETSGAKKLFFSMVVNKDPSLDEAYDPTEFNPDARGPIHDLSTQFYHTLEKAIKEERWEDAAKEYCEIKADLDKELQDADRKPIIGKLFKLFVKPHLRRLDNYKRRIPDEYLNDCDKKNENLAEGLEYIENIDEIRKGANGIPTEFEYTRFYRPRIYLPTDKGGKGELRIMAMKEEPDEEDSDWEISVEFEDESGFFGFGVPENKLAEELHNYRNPYLNGLTFEEAEDICSDIREYFMNVDQEELYSTFVDKLGCDKQDILKFYNVPSLNENVIDKFYIDEIVSAQGGKTETERHSFDTLEELKKYVKDANLTDDDIATCGGCEIDDLPVDDSLSTRMNRWLIRNGFTDDYKSPEDNGTLSDDEKEELHSYVRNRLASGEDYDDESKNEALGLGAGIAIGMIGSSLLDSMENTNDNDEELNELLDIEIDAKGFGGTGNNVSVGPSMPLTSSLKKNKDKETTRSHSKDYDDDFDLKFYN